MNLEEYKQSLNVRYTGMTEELAEKIDLTAKPKPKLNLDLNNDGKFDKKDASIAGKVLVRTRTKRKVK